MQDILRRLILKAQFPDFGDQAIRRHSVRSRADRGAIAFRPRAYKKLISDRVFSFGNRVDDLVGVELRQFPIGASRAIGLQSDDELEGAIDAIETRDRPWPIGLRLDPNDVPGTRI